MNITEDLIGRIAHLSRLSLPEEEAAAMTAELEKILQYMEVLEGLDTAGVEPMPQVIPLENVLRADEAEPSQARGELLAEAPSSDGSAFLVPRAVAEEG